MFPRVMAGTAREPFARVRSLNRRSGRSSTAGSRWRVTKLAIARSWPIVSDVAGIGQYSRWKRNQEDGPTHLPLRAGPVSNGEFVPAGETARDRAVNELIRTTVEDAAARLGTDRRRFLQGAGAVAASLAAFQLAGCGTSATSRPTPSSRGGTFTAPPPEDTVACQQALAGTGEFIFDVHTHHVIPGGPSVPEFPRNDRTGAEHAPARLHRQS